jgi:hypothetical protein
MNDEWTLEMLLEDLAKMTDPSGRRTCCSHAAAICSGWGTSSWPSPSCQVRKWLHWRARKIKDTFMSHKCGTANAVQMAVVDLNLTKQCSAFGEPMDSAGDWHDSIFAKFQAIALTKP